MSNQIKNNVLTTYNENDIKFPVVLSIPHSGTDFCDDFLRMSALSIRELRTSEDPYVDELLEPLIDKGFCAVKLNVPRSMIDVSRDKIELDKDMFFDYPLEEETLSSRRVRFGYGVVPKLNDENKEIYKEKISYKTALDRIETVYETYHKKLAEIIEKTQKKFGFCLVLDMHSMPSRICNIMIEEKPVDFCVSTLFEQSAPKELWQKLGDELGLFGYRVEYNRPYSGGFITFHYCQPKQNVHTIQLEINRSIYINEKTLEKTAAFNNLKNHLCQSIMTLVDKGMQNEA